MTLFLLTATTVTTTPAQRRGRTPAVAPPAALLPGRVQRASTDQAQPQWQAAQRSLASAIAHLEAYLLQSPAGERAQTARQQLQALKSLALDSSRPEWVHLTSTGVGDTDWRIVAVDPQAERTLVTIELKCARDDGTECGFPPFDLKPLALIDNTGAHYQMLASGERPQGVRVDRTIFKEVEWRLPAGRVVTLGVEFAPLIRSAAGGQVQYRERNQAVPVRFSLLQRARKNER